MCIFTCTHTYIHIYTYIYECSENERDRDTHLFLFILNLKIQTLFLFAATTYFAPKSHKKKTEYTLANTKICTDSKSKIRAQHQEVTLRT